ncbi:MAG: hypothetical protein ABIJ59_05425 [Pseudomonadota bacterium]
MENILIHKNGGITKKGKPITGSVLTLLGNSIKIEDNATLGSFFMMVKKYPDLFVISDILESLAQIALKEETSGFKTPEIHALIFYKTIEIKGFPGTPSLNLYNSLKGVMNEKLIALKFFHLENLLDHNLKLGDLEHVVFGDKEDALSFKTFYTLFELVEGIAWELSFNFNPLQCSIRR